MAFDIQVVIDSRDPHTLADWWADALGWEVESQDEEFIRRMVSEGQASEDDTTTHNGHLVWKAGAAIRHPEGLERAPRILFQVVPEPKTVKNRVHLDVRVDDKEKQFDRLTAAGATFLHRGSQGPFSWITITDPEGNELCLS